MADNTGMGEPLDWDDGEVLDEGAYVVLPAGVYAFGVEKLEKERFEGSSKMAPCPRAHLTLSLVAADGTTGTVHERLMLNTKMAWKIARFFQALGFQKSPETGKVPVAWNQVEGKGGYLLLKVREYEKKDGGKGQSNEVDEWLLPGDERIAQAQAPAQTAMPVPPQPAQAQHPGWSV
ncbi:hypothetical protein AALA69_07715 [Eggerthellaceae bacterium 24-137]